ncbi:hypothetical protein ASPWEDRAFT_171281 [Aspergillus wentii DTO 134E9]|uniref:Invertebrate defensins family profile domain-containing protein n=1 Tax=Aspergillus wentii DTO 134E9 TaxID=1073089 RepID=A0A1L9RSB2_ASPWE|nr:uncharacterized protein ASPWEDRAFT_171281 [Aspergillus wentii DTO 134E9]KAI9930657.1 hypothetical protein MW887_011412 [Aspergillus wentii]OJJ37820.1 hypothetical protein ASPWEDRAFT_171281 [Aspergillus wentii DTO 134E9]
MKISTLLTLTFLTAVTAADMNNSENTLVTRGSLIVKDTLVECSNSNDCQNGAVCKNLNGNCYCYQKKCVYLRRRE